jgi:hypothetical protein
MTQYKKIDLTDIKTYSIHNRKSKIETASFARPHHKNSSFAEFLIALPQILKASDFAVLVDLVVQARRQDKPVVVLMGAHVIKVGLNPILIDAMHNRIITAIAMNGAGSIHDTELAYFGTTSEDVVDGLGNGLFGMAKETGCLLNETIHLGKGSDKGFGELLGERIVADQPPYASFSLLANALQLHLPATVHVAIGTDIVHQHSNADAAAIGEASYQDFKVLAEQLTHLQPGAVVLLFGSAVILPEVFLKALTVVRNLGHPAHGFITANFDMISQYRPRVNVMHRPTLTGGCFFEFIGHHEIMIPLLFAAVKEKLADQALSS